MRAILIDPESKTITEIEVSGSLEDLYAAIGCEHVELGYHTLGSHFLYVDEEGLMPHKYHLGAFQVRAGYRIVGRALIVGEDSEGGDTDATVSLEKVAEHVVFLD